MATPAVPHGRHGGRPRPVTVPAAVAPATVPVISSPGRLCGWALSTAAAPAGAIEASVQGVAAAGATLTLTGFLTVSTVVVTPAAAWPAGANVVTVNNVSGGPIIAQIEGGTENAVTIAFSPPAGVTGTPTVVVPAIVGGPAYTVSASGSTTTDVALPAIATGLLLDGGQVIAPVGAPSGTPDVTWLTDEGVYVGTSVQLQAIAGTLSGVIYWLDDWHGGDN